MRSIDNEKQYKSLFAKYYRIRPNQDDYVTVVITDNKGVPVEIPNVSKIDHVGRAGKKTDVLIHYYIDGRKREYHISVKTNDSIYWGSDDRYIRANLALNVRRLFRENESRFFQTDTTGKIKIPRTLIRPIGVEISEAAQNYTMFGNDECDIVVRGDMSEKNVVFDTKVNLLVFRVTKIYRSVRDVMERDRPMLLVYSANNRTTFNIPPEEDEPDKDIQDYRGIRGRFSTADSVLKLTGQDNIFSFGT